MMIVMCTEWTVCCTDVHILEWCSLEAVSRQPLTQEHSDSLKDKHIDSTQHFRVRKQVSRQCQSLEWSEQRINVEKWIRSLKFSADIEFQPFWTKQTKQNIGSGQETLKNLKIPSNKLMPLDILTIQSIHFLNLNSIKFNVLAYICMQSF